MGLAQVDVDAVAGTAALADQGWLAGAADADAHPGGVGHPPARPVVAADGAFTLVDAAEGDGFPLPAVKAKDAVGLSDHLPTLQVAHLAAALLSLAHLGAIQRGGESSDLLGGEGAGHGDGGCGVEVRRDGGGSRAAQLASACASRGSISSQQGGSLQ